MSPHGEDPGPGPGDPRARVVPLGADPAPEPDDESEPTADLPLNVVALRGISPRDRYGPLGLVLGIAVAGLALMVVDFRLGTVVLAGSAITALVLRTVLPTRRAGLLVVRTRTIDMVVLSVLAGALLILAIITPSG